MTIPSERTRAVQNTQNFLRDLLDPKKTPRVPKAIRMEAYRLLKHYPAEFHLETASKSAPTVWGSPEYEDSATNRLMLKKKALHECDDEVHVWIGKRKLCQCGKEKQ